MRKLALISVGVVLLAIRLAAQQVGSAESGRPRGREIFAQQAFRLKQLAVERGDQPYGALVVREGRIVGEGVSAVVTDTDPTAHAEMQAIRDAARRLGTTDLSGCELYGSSRACPRCEAAAYFAGISRMYHGKAPVDAGAPRLPILAVSQEAAMQPMDLEAIAAAERGDLPALRNALSKGARIDARDARGRTALLAATQSNRTEAVKVLLTAGADVDLQDERLDNPFLYAEGLLEILRLLIEAGADTRLTNRFGGTALIPACERGHVEVVRELLARSDVSVNHVNNLGWTALLEAVMLGSGGTRHQQVVQLLVDHGADVTIADRGGVTPLGHARARGFRERACGGIGFRLSAFSFLNLFPARRAAARRLRDEKSPK